MQCFKHLPLVNPQLVPQHSDAVITVTLQMRKLRFWSVGDRLVQGHTGSGELGFKPCLCELKTHGCQTCCILPCHEF